MINPWGITPGERGHQSDFFGVEEEASQYRHPSNQNIREEHQTFSSEDPVESNLGSSPSPMQLPIRGSKYMASPSSEKGQPQHAGSGGTAGLSSVEAATHDSCFPVCSQKDEIPVGDLGCTVGLKTSCPPLGQHR